MKANEQPLRVSLAAGRSGRPHRLTLTPLADLVFILLIFFILETSFVEFRQLDFRQPQAATAADIEGQGEPDAAAPDPRALEIEVFSEDRVWLSGHSLAVRELAGYLRERNFDAQTLVIVSAGPAVSAQLLVTVLDGLHDARLARVLVRELESEHPRQVP